MKSCDIKKLSQLYPNFGYVDEILIIKLL